MRHAALGVVLEIRIRWSAREPARLTSDASMLSGEEDGPDRDEAGQVLLAMQTGGA
jgi:hypothetical protein